MAFKIDMEEGTFKKEICEAVDAALESAIQEIIDENAEEVELTAEQVVEAYHDNAEIREALHEEIDAQELVEEKSLSIDDIFDRRDIVQFVCENLKPRDCFTLEDLVYDVKKSDRLDREDVIEIIEALDLSPLDLFDKTELLLAAVDPANANPKTAAANTFYTLDARGAPRFMFEFVNELSTFVQSKHPDPKSNATFQSLMDLTTADLVAIFDARVDFRDAIFERLDEHRDSFVEQRKWHAGDLFTKVDLATALLDYEDSVTAEAAASTFLGTLSGDFGEKYIEAFVAHLWQITFADNVPTPKLAPPAKPDAKGELKALLTKLLSALD